MKRKTIYVSLLILTAMLSMVSACKESAAKDGQASSDVINVGLVCSVGGLGDQSINDQAQMGMDWIAKDFGVQTRTFEPMEDSQVLDMIQRLCELKYDLIVIDAFSLEDPMIQCAIAYPDQRFMILDTVVDLPNVMSFTYATHNGSFLAGVAAALKTESKVIGFVGGMNIPVIKKFELGFIEGIQYVDPSIRVISKYIGNDDSAWNDPATAKSLTLDMIANGADICYHAAGASGMGMIEACKEKGIWAIGVNIDQAHLAPDIMLTSMLTRGDVAIYVATEKMLKGEKVSGHVILDCDNDGVGIVMNDFFTAEEKSKIEDARTKIIAGDIVVTDAMAN